MSHCTTPWIILSQTECTQWNSFKCTVWGFLLIKQTVCMSDSENTQQVGMNVSLNFFSPYMLACVFAYVFNILQPICFLSRQTEEAGPQQNVNPHSWRARSDNCWITHVWITDHLSLLPQVLPQPLLGETSSRTTFIFTCWKWPQINTWQGFP